MRIHRLLPLFFDGKRETEADAEGEDTAPGRTSRGDDEADVTMSRRGDAVVVVRRRRARCIILPR